MSDCIKVSRRLGLQGIEIGFRSPAELDRTELEKLLRVARVQLVAVASGRVYLEDGLSLSDNDGRRRANAISRLQELIDYAAAFGASVIVGAIRGGRPLDGDVDAAVERLLQSVRECADHAALLGTNLMVEAVNRYETGMLNTAAQAMAAVERIGRPNVRVLLDAFHMNIEEASIGEAIRATGSHLGHFHIADSNRLAPGMGHIDYAEVITTLRSVGYEGWLSAEVLPLPDDRTAAEQVRRFVEQID